MKFTLRGRAFLTFGIIIILILNALYAYLFYYIRTGEKNYAEAVKREEAKIIKIDEIGKLELCELNKDESVSKETGFSGWQLIAAVELPAYKSSLYTGAYENATAGAKQLTKAFKEIKSSKQYRVLQDDIITLTVANGYGNAEEGFAYGVCWAVSALGYAQDVSNRDFKKLFGYDLFVGFKRYPHSRKRETYTLVNGGYGYAIYDSPPNMMDYTFNVNPKFFQDFKDGRIKIETKAIFSEKAYKGKSIEASVWIKF